MTAKLQPQDDQRDRRRAFRAYLARLLSDRRVPGQPAPPQAARVRGRADAGRARDRLKAYDLAVAVLGRDERFDPQNDPIVRIEVGRLRRDLEHYYADAGSGDPIRIAIPKGHYVPTFEIAGAQRAGPAVRAARRCRRLPGWLLGAVAMLCAILLGVPSGTGRRDTVRRSSGRGRPSWCCRSGHSGAARAISSWRAASPPT